MATWFVLTIVADEAVADELVERASEYFDHYPTNTSVRYRDGKVSISTRRERDVFRDVITDFKESGDIAAVAEVNNTVEYGWIHVYEHTGNGAYKVEKISEPSPNHGNTAAHTFSEEYGFHPETSEFSVETWWCATCLERFAVEDGEVHTHKVNDGHADNKHESVRYEIWEEFTFGNAGKWEEPTPDKVAQIYNTEADEIIKEVEGTDSTFTDNSITKCSTLIEVLKGSSVEEAEI